MKHIPPGGSGPATGQDGARHKSREHERLGRERLKAGDGTPFSGLSPEYVVAAVEALGMRSDGRLLALNSYENRVYQVGMDEGAPLVVKFYRPGRWSDAMILEEHAFTQELAAQEIPAVPPIVSADGRTLHQFGGFRLAAFVRRGGRAPELSDDATLSWLGRFLGRIHAVGAAAPFQHRPELTLAEFGEEPSAYLLAGGFLPDELADHYRASVARALAGVRRCFAEAGAFRRIRLHGDCHAGNVLWTEAGPHFVDFDDSRSGPAVQDLWMLLSGNREEMARQMDRILAGYERFRDFDRRELHLVEALRTLRLIHYSAWIARRWDDPAFPAGFPWFNTRGYWQERIAEIEAQIALMDEPPLALD